MVKFYIIAVLLLIQQPLTAQKKVLRIPDSLVSKPYGYFERQIAATADRDLKLHFANFRLQKSNAENDIVQKVSAYRTIMHLVDKDQRLQYADSLLYAAKFTGDNALIGSAYLTTGAAYYDNKQHAKALENYLKASTYISHTNDAYLQHKAAYTIANMKHYLGYYHEAISLYDQCIAFFREENDLAYLKSLHGIGLCYNRLGKFEKSSRYNQIGLAAGREMANPVMAPYFTHSEGINRFCTADYHGAIKLLNESMGQITKNDDFANEAIALFYIGKSYWELGQREKAVHEFKKTDSIISKREYYHPDLKENYELLIAYYENAGDHEMKIQFMSAQIKMFQALNRNYRELPGKIYKEYDTNKLVGKMSKAELAMKREKIAYAGVIVVLTATVVFGYGRHVKNRRFYRKRFEELMRSPLPQKTVAAAFGQDSELNIKPEVVAAVLKKLEKFEAKNKYTDQDLVAAKVASMLNTNQKYLSKIILRYRGKNFIQYLSDLRIDYVVDLLKTQPMCRNYTNKALGEMAGFGSTQIFTQAFKLRTGIRPTYFINELKKESDFYISE